MNSEQHRSLPFARREAAPRHFKPDPYDGFACDRERRRALNFRMACRTITALLLALALWLGGNTVALAQAARWIKVLATMAA
jgi:hypothetical protein